MFSIVAVFFFSGKKDYKFEVEHWVFRQHLKFITDLDPSVTIKLFFII